MDAMHLVPYLEKQNNNLVKIKHMLQKHTNWNHTPMLVGVYFSIIQIVHNINKLSRKWHLVAGFNSKPLKITIHDYDDCSTGAEMILFTNNYQNGSDFKCPYLLYNSLGQEMFTNDLINFINIYKKYLAKCLRPLKPVN